MFTREHISDFARVGKDKLAQTGVLPICDPSATSGGERLLPIPFQALARLANVAMRMTAKGKEDPRDEFLGIPVRRMGAPDWGDLAGGSSPWAAWRFALGALFCSSAGVVLAAAFAFGSVLWIVFSPFLLPALAKEALALGMLTAPALVAAAVLASLVLGRLRPRVWVLPVSCGLGFAVTLAAVEIEGRLAIDRIESCAEKAGIEIISIAPFPVSVGNAVLGAGWFERTPPHAVGRRDGTQYRWSYGAADWVQVYPLLGDDMSAAQGCAGK